MREHTYEEYRSLGNQFPWGRRKKIENSGHNSKTFSQESVTLVSVLWYKNIDRLSGRKGKVAGLLDRSQLWEPQKCVALSVNAFKFLVFAGSANIPQENN